MRARQILGLGALLAGITLATPLTAQQARAGGRHPGPRVVIRAVPPRAALRVVRPRPVIVERFRPVRRVVVVRPYRAPVGVAWGWWGDHGFLQATLWVDRQGRYFDRDHGGLHPVTVYERDGRYFLPDAIPDRGP
jgi:hypothetical protein